MKFFNVIYLYILKSAKVFKQRTNWKNSFYLKYHALHKYHTSFNLVGGLNYSTNEECKSSDKFSEVLRNCAVFGSSLIYNTSKTLATPVRPECGTSATLTTRVRHEWKTLILITARVKTYFHTIMFTIWQMKDYKDRNNFILRTAFWKCHVYMPKYV